MSVVLLISTYELGAQPLGLAGVAGALRDAGHEVLTCDLAVQPWPDAAVMAADVLCCSVPMHTALRLAAEVAERAHATRPGLPIYFYGLYAEVARAAGLLRPGDAAIERDEAQGLVTACQGLDQKTSTGAQPPAAPAAARIDREGLPGLENYARFQRGDEERLVASVAASIGCNHRCRHCPVPVVYDGRSLAVEHEQLLEDVEGLVAAGATHVHFADPDFLNRPPHARRVVAALHRAHPELSFDATVKVSHLLRFSDVLGELRAAGLTFVVSAFESTSDVVLTHLDKGHVSADLHRCIEVLRRDGIEPRPSFLPFTPWTTRDDLVELLDFIASHDLVENIDPVQYGIRLLLPARSLLLTDPDPVLAASLVGPDPGALGVTWRAADPLLDELALAISSRAEEAASLGEATRTTYLAIREMVFDALQRRDRGLPALVVPPGPPAAERPHLTESWFCCAEPTASQLGPIGLGLDRVGAAPVFLGTSIRAQRVSEEHSVSEDQRVSKDQRASEDQRVSEDTSVSENQRVFEQR